MDEHDIACLSSVGSTAMANEYLHLGWVLCAIMKVGTEESSGPLYVLGWPRANGVPPQEPRQAVERRQRERNKVRQSRERLRALVREKCPEMLDMEPWTTHFAARPYDADVAHYPWWDRPEE